MTEEIAGRGIDFMFRSPSTALKLEFQGGEPLLNFGIVKYIVEKTRTLSQANGRPVTIVICSNLSLVTDEILEFCDQHDVNFFDFSGWAADPAQPEQAKCRFRQL